MDKDIELFNNLLKIATAKGTKEEKKIGKTREEIDEILSEGAATLKARLILLKAFQANVVGRKKEVKKVLSIFDKMKVNYQDGL